MAKGKCGNICNHNFKVHIKWGKETFKDIEIDLESDGLTFKSQIYALTNVPVES